MRWVHALFVGLPIAIACRLLHAPDWCVFVGAVTSLVPLAHWIGEGSEQLAARAGPSLGGLLTATFANAAELIITILALSRGLVDLVKASITGSIIANTLLTMGASALVGGLRHGWQKFPLKPTGRHAAMMILAVAALVVPASFAHMQSSVRAREEVSIGVSILLLLTYAASIYYAHVWVVREDRERADRPRRARRARPLGPTVGLLAGSVLGATAAGELVVESVQGFSRSAGLSESFIGLILIPLVGNAAEQFAAIRFAADNRIDLSFSIAANSSTQIALFVAPVLVLVSLFYTPMDLVLPSIQLVTLLASSAIFAYLSLDGETNWFEGVQLLALYLIAATAFFFLS